MLATVLVLLVLLLVAGMAFMGARVLQYRSTVDAAATAQALALAEAGLEDARVKLEKDLAFFPRPAPMSSSASPISRTCPRSLPAFRGATK